MGGANWGIRNGSRAAMCRKGARSAMAEAMEAPEVGV